MNLAFRRLLLVFAVFSATSVLLCQNSIPGLESVKTVYGAEIIDSWGGEFSEKTLELSCFAAYGWHFSSELKSEIEVVSVLEGEEGIPEKLLRAKIKPGEYHQAFSLPSGGYIVVMDLTTFKRVYERYLINVNKAKH